MWDADDNELLDFTLSQGPCILGHSHPELLERVIEAIREGQLYAGQHEQEVVLAETLQRLIPCAERVRFSSTGSEAAHTVLRLARYVTGKQKFIKFEGHYHGWFDNVSFNINQTKEQMGEVSGMTPVPWGGGVPASAFQDVIPLRWNDLAVVERTLRERGHEIGAIITEPVMANQGCIEPQPGYLDGLRQLCDAYDVALIFDEIITGVRLDLGGAQSYYGVTPDLALFGKALAGGFPLSAIVGKERFMEPLEDSSVIHAGTLNGNTACVAASLATLEVLERNDREVHSALVQRGLRLRDGLKELTSRLRSDILVQGPGPMFHMGFIARESVTEYRHVLDYDKPLYIEFCQRMRQSGVRLIERGLWYISAAHTDNDIDQCLDVVAASIKEIS
jgi:glutamate-1-semialdehyde 2,1-aminomutase